MAVGFGFVIGDRSVTLLGQLTGSGNGAPSRHVPCMCGLLACLVADADVDVHHKGVPSTA
eukprot:365018-Chlamydomonas_euryale.AAC.13